MDEEALAGGIANPGAVVRVGGTVRRPWQPHTPAVHALLDHLVEHGMAGAVPTRLGADDQGREVLTYLPGRVALPPYPDWVADGALLVAVAEQQRRLHVAAASFTPPPGAVWGGHGYFPAGVDGDVVCHNDLCVENVVVGEDGGIGFIDFDYARPVDPLFDIAVAARHWVPVWAPELLVDARRELDLVSRFRAFLEVHELAAAARARVVALLRGFLVHARANVARLAAEGHPGFAQLIAAGYEEQNEASQRWVRANAAALAR